jgi:ribosomal protein L9
MSKKRISVIVADDLPGFGSKGEVRTVRPGHARNYLFPKKVRPRLFFLFFCFF